MVKVCTSQQKQRILNKFTENDHEKVERLLELHFKYLERVRACDKVIEREKRVGVSNTMVSMYFLTTSDSLEINPNITTIFSITYNRRIMSIKYVSASSSIILSINLCLLVIWQQTQLFQELS